MRQIILDGKKMYTKSAMFAYFIQKFDLPNHLNHNLDALWDVLTEISEPTKISFHHSEDMIEYLNDYGERVLQLFYQLEKYNNHIDVFIK